jgi:hypothetical protein
MRHIHYLLVASYILQAELLVWFGLVDCFLALQHINTIYAKHKTHYLVLPLVTTYNIQASAMRLFFKPNPTWGLQQEHEQQGHI